MAFFGGFLVALLIFSEYNTATSSETFRVLFKRGSKSPIMKEAKTATDEEKSLASTQPAGDQDSQDEGKKALAEQPPMSNVFSWQHVNYVVHVSDGDRLLLNDVSGYVAPGKLTALMGESGAGKVNSDKVQYRRLG
jgi:ATP-binding cassette subfamily G (WHITE) protein 2 (SNQ2)